MARVLITYTANDRDLAMRVEEWLVSADHFVVRLEGLRLTGEGLKDRAVQEINQAQYVLAILTRNSWASSSFAFELGLVRNLEEALQRPVLVGLAVDDAPVPTILGSRPTIRLVTVNFEASIEPLRAVLRRPVTDVVPESRLAFAQAQALIDRPDAAPAWARALNDLAAAVRDDQVVLFLGAGVSFSAGIPGWGDLVDRVMTRVFDRSPVPLPANSHRVARLMRTHSKASDLILAQHARRELGRDFQGILRHELYRTATGRSRLLSALGELVVRDRAKAAVTYNFDDFLESELRRRGLDTRIVDREGQPDVPGFPVFHVHGLLRRNGFVRQDGLVFAESEFHDESLDPYRWSALIQVANLVRSTCLFVGSSIQDPNMRRLLRVVKKRNPEDVGPHFVIFKHTNPAAVAGEANPPISAAEAIRARDIIDNLIETDLNELGLQVIWVDSHEEVADVVSELATATVAAAA